jgi:hypothetical protein
MLSDAEEAEHRRLSELAYGRSPQHPLSADDLARLQELERRRGGRAEEPVDTDEAGLVPDAADAPPPSVAAGAVEAEPPAPAPLASRARRGRLRIALVAAAVVCAAALGWAAGAATGGAPATPAQPPELTRPATDEDVLDVPDLRIDPASARFIARVDDVDVYLARGAENGLVCIVTISPAVGPSAGCGQWSPETGGIMVGIGDDTMIALGPLAPERPPGSAFALSETVFAIRTG